jgi:hypothetical protein
MESEKRGGGKDKISISASLSGPQKSSNFGSTNGNTSSPSPSIPFSAFGTTNQYARIPFEFWPRLVFYSLPLPKYGHHNLPSNPPTFAIIPPVPIFPALSFPFQSPATCPSTIPPQGGLLAHLCTFSIPAELMDPFNAVFSSNLGGGQQKGQRTKVKWQQRRNKAILFFLHLSPLKFLAKVAMDDLNLLPPYSFH